MSAAIKCAGCGKVEDTTLDDGFTMNRRPQMTLPAGWTRLIAIPAELEWHGDRPAHLSADDWDVCSKECAVVAIAAWAGLRRIGDPMERANLDAIEKEKRAGLVGEQGPEIATFGADGQVHYPETDWVGPIVPVPGEDPQWVIPKVELEEDFDVMNWQGVRGRDSYVEIGAARGLTMEADSALALAAWLVVVAEAAAVSEDLTARFLAVLDKVRST